jgi:hypothetical protein
MTAPLATPSHQMPQYQIGDLVAVDRTAVPPAAAYPHRRRTSEESPAWLAALIEGIDRPGVAPSARYRIRLLEGPGSGRSWRVSLGALRPWHRTTPPPAPTVA